MSSTSGGNDGVSDPTTPEVQMPDSNATNEGQVSAFKDPLANKIWIFWTSTRSGTSDIYYQTISPEFYPSAAGQQ